MSITDIKKAQPVQRVVASFGKANSYLGEAQKTCNQQIRMYLDADLSMDYNADKLAYWRAELAGVRKLQAVAMVIQG